MSAYLSLPADKKKHIQNAIGLFSDGRSGLHYVGEIEDEKIENAIAKYASTLNRDQIVCLFDDTMFGSAEEGFVVTERGIYSNMSFQKKYYINYRILSKEEISERLKEIGISNENKTLILIDTLRDVFIVPGERLNNDDIKAEANAAAKDVLKQLENDYPGITEGIASFVGAGTGAAGSLGAISMLGIPGLSAPGITSGLAALGSLVGGGMVAGIAVAAAPVAGLGVAAYAIAKKRKSAKLAAALGQAINKLYDIQTRLMANAEFFKEEIAGIKAMIEVLSGKNPGKV